MLYVMFPDNFSGKQKLRLFWQVRIIQLVKTKHVSWPEALKLGCEENIVAKTHRIIFVYPSCCHTRLILKFQSSLNSCKSYLCPTVISHKVQSFNAIYFSIHTFISIIGCIKENKRINIRCSKVSFLNRSI